jgi:CBS domain containing-hemolysin-like protein
MTLLIAFVVLAIGVSFTCSVLEACLLSVSPSYVADLEKHHPVTSARLKKQKDDIEGPLVAILTLNTIAHTLGATGAGAQASLIFDSTGVGIFSAVLTFAILFLSEIIPKTIGARFWRQLAPLASRIISIIIPVTLPLVWMSRGVTRLMGEGHSQPYIRAEIVAMSNIGLEEGELNAQESKLIQEILDARSLTARDIMTPRPVIAAFPQRMPLQVYATEHGDASFSRLMVYADSMDEPRGYLIHAEALHAAGLHPQRDLSSVTRPALLVTEDRRVPGLFDQMLHSRSHMAFVMNEYGVLQGLITMEDIIESMLGVEIVEQGDPAEDMQAEARRRFEAQQQQQ